MIPGDGPIRSTDETKSLLSGVISLLFSPAAAYRAATIEAG